MNSLGLRLIFILGYLGFGCSAERPDAKTSLDFRLDREGTIDGTIFLNVEADSKEKFLVSFESDGDALSFVAPPGVLAEISGSSQIPISTDVKGEHYFKFTIYTLDAVALGSADFSFIYKYDLIDVPVIALSEKASKDQFVTLKVSSAQSKKIDQVWIEGDVSKQLRSRWIDINLLNEVDISLLPGAGVKNFKVKVRNKYGAESPFKDFSFSLDPVSPGACRVDIAADKIGSQLLNVRMVGEDESALKFSVSGDVGNYYSDIEFESGDSFWIEVSSGDGEKNLLFAVSDIADNFCLVENRTIIRDRLYNPIGVSIVGNPVYQYSNSVDLDLRLDAFNKQDYEIYISGGVDDAPGIKEWIPYTDSLTVSLAAPRGNRVVYFKMRHKGKESQHVYDYVYLNPRLNLVAGVTYEVIPPNIVDTDTITITGCLESYINVAYQQKYDCTPAAASVSVTMFFKDASQLSLVENF